MQTNKAINPIFIFFTGRITKRPLEMPKVILNPFWLIIIRKFSSY